MKKQRYEHKYPACKLAVCLFNGMFDMWGFSPVYTHLDEFQMDESQKKTIPYRRIPNGRL